MTPEQRELKPCPFCGGAARIERNRDWHRLYADHDEDCALYDANDLLMFPAQPGYLKEIADLWNRRAQVEALTVPQWISVEERLPPIGEEVIVFVPGGRVPVTALMRLIRWEGSTDFYWDNAYPGKGNMHIATSITHWKPMDAAPTIPAIPVTKEGA